MKRSERHHRGVIIAYGRIISPIEIPPCWNVNLNSFSYSVGLVSTMGQQALVLEAVQAGAIDYVVKPFQSSKVLESIGHIIEK
ncbi:hypothetical protein ES703_104533 [subsurface metagenome]